MTSGVIDIPQQIKINSCDDETYIQLRWFSQRYIPPVVVFALLLPTLLLYFIQQAIYYKAWFVFPVLLPAIIYVVYVLLAKLFNSSIIRLTTEALTVEHGPLPFKRKSFFKLQNLNEILIESKQYPGKSRRTYYEVFSKSSEAKKSVLLSDIDQYDQARFIADKLIEHLAKCYTG